MAAQLIFSAWAQVVLTFIYKSEFAIFLFFNLWHFQTYKPSFGGHVPSMLLGVPTGIFKVGFALFGPPDPNFFIFRVSNHI